MVKWNINIPLTYLRSTPSTGWSTAGVADSKFISESLLLKCYPYKPSERVFIKVISLRSFCTLSLVYQLSLSLSTSQLVVGRTVRVLGILLGQLALVTFARSLLGQSIRGLGLGYILVTQWQSLSGLPDTLVSRVSGLGHPGGVEHQVDVVVLVEDRWVRQGASVTII